MLNIYTLKSCKIFRTKAYFDYSLVKQTNYTKYINSKNYAKY